MSAIEKLVTPSLQGQVSPEEWALRQNLAAAYRLVALFGWSDLGFTHISARVPGPEHHFLINPYGFLFDEITASSLVKVDLQGRKVSDSPYPVNPAGFTIHSAIHAAREDAHCVLHVHSANGVAISARQSGLLPISQQSIFVMASLAYHDYEGVALMDDEKPRLVRDLGTNNYLMLRNHGLLTVGANPAEAFLAMYVFESCCNIQVRAQGGGAGAAAEALIEIPQTILDAGAAQLQQVTFGQGAGLVWPALLRKLDRVDPGWRE
ncbi:MAG: class II aldolase/adducin family protein [Nevskia sp.]